MTTTWPSAIFAGIGVLFLVRNAVVYCHKERRRDWIHSHNQAKINAGLYDQKLDYSKAGGNYHAMMLDLRKWTYKQFYGDEA